MSLIKLLETVQKNKPYLNKDEIAEELAEIILQEVPELAKLNTSSLRTMIFNLIDLGKHHEDGLAAPYHICRASAVTIPYAKGRVTFTASETKIYKVCPKCKMTANVTDPICPNCNYLYLNAEDEEKVAVSAIDALYATKEVTELDASPVILNDEVEGFKVTEADVIKCMRDVHKYLPRS